jgi:hypothetical protein
LLQLCSGFVVDQSVKNVQFQIRKDHSGIGFMIDAMGQLAATLFQQCSDSFCQSSLFSSIAFAIFGSSRRSFFMYALESLTMSGNAARGQVALCRMRSVDL